MPQQMRMGIDPGGLREGPERPAGMLRPHRGVALGAQHQVERDRPGGLAGLDQQQPQRRSVALHLLVVAQGVEREGGQAQHGLAGGGLEGPTTSSLPRAPSGRGRPVASCWSMLRKEESMFAFSPSARPQT